MCSQIVARSFSRIAGKAKAASQSGSDLIWVWLKIKELGLRRCLSLVPNTRVPFLVHLFEPQPYADCKAQAACMPRCAFCALSADMICTGPGAGSSQLGLLEPKGSKCQAQPEAMVVKMAWQKDVMHQLGQTPLWAGRSLKRPSGFRSFSQHRKRPFSRSAWLQKSMVPVISLWTVQDQVCITKVQLLWKTPAQASE